MQNKIKISEMTVSEAKRWAEEIDHLSEPVFEGQLDKWRAHHVDDVHSNLLELRSVCVQAFDGAGGVNLGPKKMYPIDVEVGLALYCYLERHGFSLVDAANDDIWRYLSIRVFPDLTFFRYPEPEAQAKEQGCRLNRKRFYSHTRRIWIKTLWWYVFLSWQGSAEATRLAIESNGSNIISHFIETPGKGYRVELYRTLMKMYSTNPDKKDKLFRAVAKLNGAECRNIEPDLMPGGVEEYCRVLFDKVSGH